jgi:uncharacterized protein YggU (UPF0235/DUF167 family)
MCNIENVQLAVEAHPNARLERVELLGSTLRVWVRARPAEGRANAAIERFLAKALGLRRRQVQIVAGPTARHKLVELDIADLDELRARLIGGGFSRE